MLIATAEATGNDEHIAILLVELGLIFFALGVLGRVAQRLRIPVIPLYLIGGLMFGQGGLAPFNASHEFFEAAAEIGVILLLLMLGLEYSPQELRGSLREQYPMGILDALLNALPGAAIALIAGWGPVAAVALAGITWVSSSGVIAKMLSDSGRLGNRETPAILGILVMEDLAMALFLPILTATLAGGGAKDVALAVAVSLVTVSVVLTLATRFGRQVTKLVSANSDEALLLGVLGLTMFVAGIAEQLKVSAAVGAFLVGIAVSGTVAHAASVILTPLRDLFAAAFFVFFGLSTNPGTLLGALPWALLLVIITSVTKLATGYLSAKRAGVRRKGRWRAAVTLIPRGEFSVVVAALAIGGGADPAIGPVAACYVLLTIVLGAAVFRLPDRLRAEAPPTRPPPHLLVETPTPRAD